MNKEDPKNFIIAMLTLYLIATLIYCFVFAT